MSSALQLLISYLVYRFTGSTPNLVKHKCLVANSTKSLNICPIDISAATKKDGVAVITERVVKNCRTFKIIDDSGLRPFGSYFLNVVAIYGGNNNIHCTFCITFMLQLSFSTIFYYYLQQERNLKNSNSFNLVVLVFVRTVVVRLSRTRLYSFRCHGYM